MEPETRTFIFNTPSISNDEATLLESILGISEVDLERGEAVDVTITFDCNHLMEVADGLAEFGHLEAEQQIYEENYDLLTDEEE